ncbi:Alpha-ketoglutarate-dependent dioxygenase alkB 6 [Entomophthora muscae]|uniref:Alpha-ketoglutarate-dependent dioxygenase alkB 6 n=1 Tax=Entomophthora muscae TaxID=34485 RepID=A0ACC2T4Y7_9FUNG|nr:Alpha-ketoglutarate-dependent dioxygenase alkB 6 [Entomophthora muscae]
MMQEPLPAWLSGLSKAIHSTLLAPAQEGLVESSLQLFSEFNHVLVNEYLPGQGIFAHEDGPFYHPMVATLSLGSHTIINYRPKHSALETDPSLKGFSLFIEPRSLVVMSEKVYRDFTHEIEPKTADRVSCLTECENFSQCAIKDFPSEIQRGARISLTFRHVKNSHKLPRILGFVKPMGNK